MNTVQISGSSEILQLHELLKELKQQNLWTIGIVILCFVIGTFVFKYYVSRSIEQAKSDVTKKDIKEITEKVEAVKTEFVKEIERLKVNLQFENIVKSTIYTERKESVIKLYESVQAWFQIIDSHLLNSSKYLNEKLNAAEEEIEKHFYHFVITEAKAQLYIKDDTFFELCSKVSGKITELENISRQLIGSMREINNNEFATIDDEERATAKACKQNWENSKTPRTELLVLLDEFRDKCFDFISTP
jgi:hypothetical protein